MKHFHFNQANGFFPKNIRLVQLLNINQSNSPQRKKSCDYLKNAENSFDITFICDKHSMKTVKMR